MRPGPAIALQRLSPERAGAAFSPAQKSRSSKEGFMLNQVPLPHAAYPFHIPGAIMSSPLFHTLPLDLIHQAADFRK
jgi:hypothetical protein